MFYNWNFFLIELSKVLKAPRIEIMSPSHPSSRAWGMAYLAHASEFRRGFEAQNIKMMKKKIIDLFIGISIF